MTNPTPAEIAALERHIAACVSGGHFGPAVCRLAEKVIEGR